MSLPPFSDSDGRHYIQRFAPPYSFDGVTTRLFPLRARLPVLQSFVDQYLNFIPAEHGRFRAFLPYVFLMILDYGKLSQRAANLGWFSQHEILFAIPLEWYKVVGGKWIFHDWATTSPFIFVDSETSLMLGRQLVGWPKALCVMEPIVNRWVDDPRAPDRLATVSAVVYPKVYAGARPERRVFLEVRRDSPMPLFTLPTGATAAQLTPWGVASEALRGAFDLTRDLSALLTNLGETAGSVGLDQRNFRRMAEQLMRSIDPARRDIYVNTINLKQFRSASSPHDYCYQALTNGRIRTTTVSDGGLLRDVSASPGDLRGGYSIRIVRWPNLPIVDTLGLEVAREWQGDGAPVAELHPVMPIWYESDMAYDHFENIAFRAFDGRWNSTASTNATPPPEDLPVTTARTDTRFNTALGSASQAIAGPFRFADTTMQVLPLLADRRRLQSFIDGYLNHPLNRDTSTPTGSRFRVWGPPGEEHGCAYVYLVATHFGEVTSASNNIGAWASQELSFLVPVQWYTRAGTGERLASIGLLPVVTFTDNHTAMVSNSEILGVPTRMGRFVCPPNMWMRDPSRQRRHALLTVSTEVLPTVGLGQQVSEHPIVEVCGGDPVPLEAAGARPAHAETFAPLLVEELARKAATQRHQTQSTKTARALALEVLAHGLPWNVFTMKQFRDVQQTDRACYQSIVVLPRRIEELREIREIETPMHVRINSYPELPIVELLGLHGVPLPSEEGEGGVPHLLQPVRPFWASLSFTQELAQGLCFRDTSDAWKEAAPPRWYFDGDPADVLPVGRSLEDAVNEAAPLRLRSIARAWREAHTDRITRAEAVAAMETVDPQSIIESILSREWENHDEQARWQVRKRELEQELHNRLTRAAAGEGRAVELAYYHEVLDGLCQSQFQSPVLAEAREKLRLLEALVAACDKFEGTPTGGAAESSAAIESALASLAAVDKIGPADASNLRRLRERLALPLDGARRSELLAEEHRQRSRAVLEKLAKAAQKPDYCVGRAMFGPERDRMFPLEESWDTEWYVGSAR